MQTPSIVTVTRNNIFSVCLKNTISFLIQEEGKSP
jgi:hypothetical protein